MTTKAPDHRAGIEWALRHAGRFMPTDAMSSAEAIEYAERINAAGCLLASVRAAWPGENAYGSHARRGRAGYWCTEGWALEAQVWCDHANAFESTYGLKVDEPWLVQLMESV